MKYNKLINLEYDDSPLMDGEQLIWKGKPKKSYFILSDIAAVIPFVLIWMVFDGFMIGAFFLNMTKELKLMMPFIGLFFAIHLMPVWIWLSEIIGLYKEWKNTEYYITDKRVIVKNGLHSGRKESIYYKNVVDVNMKVGKIEKLFGIGDIYIKTTHGVASFMDIKESKEVYTILQNTVKEAQKDMSIANIYKKEKNQKKSEKINTKETKE